MVNPPENFSCDEELAALHVEHYDDLHGINLPGDLNSCDDISIVNNLDTTELLSDFESFDRGGTVPNSNSSTDDDGAASNDEDFDYDQDVSSTSFHQRQRLITIQAYANSHCLDNSALSDFMMVLKCLSPTAAEGLPKTASGIRKRLLLDKVRTTYKYNCAICGSGIQDKLCRHPGVDTYVDVSFEDLLKLKFDDSSFVEGLKWRFKHKN